MPYFWRNISEIKIENKLANLICFKVQKDFSTWPFKSTEVGTEIRIGMGNNTLSLPQDKDSPRRWRLIMEEPFPPNHQT